MGVFHFLFSFVFTFFRFSGEDGSINIDAYLARCFEYNNIDISDLVDDELVGVSEALAGLQAELLLVLRETRTKSPQGIRSSDKHGVPDLKTKQGCIVLYCRYTIRAVMSRHTMK